MNQVSWFTVRSDEGFQDVTPGVSIPGAVTNNRE
jgi:hypothetical protein